MSKQGRNECIEHDGIVQKSGDSSVTVTILSASACSGCHSSGSCTLSGTKEKTIDVSGNYNVSPGDRVTVLMKQSAGYTALFFGYIFPLIVVLTLLIILTAISVPETLSGLLSLASLLPYYLILWLAREKLSKKFTFTIKA